MNRIVDRLTQYLSTHPDSPVGSGNIGARQPAIIADLPTIVISLRIDDVKGNGLGGFVREGNSPTRSTSSIDVAATEETFAPGLQTLRIAPLPIIRNPGATTRTFSQQDIQIRNITNQSHPIEYQLIDRPTQANQFLVNLSRGEITFGKPQTAGDRLELVHWTLTWREDIHADRYSGLVTLEAWSSTFNDLNLIVQMTLAKLRGMPELLRQKGFRRFLPAGLSPATQARWQPVLGAEALVCRQAMEFHFTIEIEEGGEISSGGVIRRIDVQMDETVDQQFSVPPFAEFEKKQ